MAHIILADDDAVALDLAARALVGDGHDVQRCCDGHEALQRLMAEPESCDILVTDVNMPVLDGITLAERALAIAPQIRILLMSGFAGECERARHLESKAVRFVAKPLTLDELRLHVRAVLS
jgi:CheY-like chemotaxis protein